MLIADTSKPEMGLHRIASAEMCLSPMVVPAAMVSLCTLPPFFCPSACPSLSPLLSLSLAHPRPAALIVLPRCQLAAITTPCPIFHLRLFALQTADPQAVEEVRSSLQHLATQRYNPLTHTSNFHSLLLTKQGFAQRQRQRQPSRMGHQQQKQMQQQYQQHRWRQQQQSPPPHSRSRQQRQFGQPRRHHNGPSHSHARRGGTSYL